MIKIEDDKYKEILRNQEFFTNMIAVLYLNS